MQGWPLTPHLVSSPFQTSKAWEDKCHPGIFLGGQRVTWASVLGRQISPSKRPPDKREGRALENLPVPMLEHFPNFPMDHGEKHGFKSITCLSILEKKEISYGF